MFPTVRYYFQLIEKKVLEANSTLESNRALVKRSYSGHADTVKKAVIVDSGLVVSYSKRDTARFSRLLGAKQYELSNHLGNVLATVSDGRVKLYDSSSSSYYSGAEVVSAQDYYAYGSRMPGRTYSLQRINESAKCLSCKELGKHLDSFKITGDLLDTSALKTYLNAKLQRAETAKRYLTEARSCGLLKEYVRVNPNSRLWDASAVLAPHPKYNPGRGDFSVETWVRMEGTGGQGMAGAPRYIWPGNPLWPGYANASSGWILSRASDGKLSFSVFEPVFSGQKVAAVKTQDTLSRFAWHHVAAVRKGNKADSFKLYVDGVLMSKTVTSNQLTHGNLDTLQGIGRLTLGENGYEYPTHDFMKGALKGFRFWKRELTASEVAASYASGCGERASGDASLVVDIPVWEGKGDTARDQAPFPAHAKLSTTDTAKLAWRRELKDTGCWSAGMTGMCGKGCGESAKYFAGFGSQEKDDEIAGEGNIYTAQFWEYDSRLVRRWNLDPKPTVGISDYAVFNCNPALNIDPLGDKPTKKEAAAISAHVYGDKKDDILKGGWRKSDRDVGVKNYDNSINGLKSALYERTITNGKHKGEIEYTYATAGTEDGTDWQQNLSQPNGLSSQYSQSAKNAELISQVLGKGTELTFTGHSLGGGLAALNSYKTDRAAVTFNAAGVSAVTVMANAGISGLFSFMGDRLSAGNSKIDAHIWKTDPLNLIQNNVNYAPDVNGKRHYEMGYSKTAIQNGHSMDNFLRLYQINPTYYQLKAK